MTRRPRRLPPGRAPWDSLNGLRVGVFSGGLLGALATAVTDVSNAWLVLVGGAFGGVVGYWSERRRT